MHAHSCAAVTFQLQQTGAAEGFMDWSPVNSVGLLYPFCCYPRMQSCLAPGIQTQSPLLACCLQLEHSARTDLVQEAQGFSDSQLRLMHPML